MRCLVCDTETPGDETACSVECATFIFVRPKDETPDERTLTAWRWRQRRAEVRGELFVEPCPMDEAERTLVVRMSMLRAHLPDVARDIEHRAGVTCERLWPERFPNEASMRGAT
jgi:hypothetical protein